MIDPYWYVLIISWKDQEGIIYTVEDSDVAVLYGYDEVQQVLRFNFEKPYSFRAATHEEEEYGIHVKVLNEIYNGVDSIV